MPKSSAAFRKRRDDRYAAEKRKDGLFARLLLLVFAFVFFRIGIDFIDLDRGILSDIEAFAAVIADLVWIEVADLAFHTAVAFLLVVEDAHFPFHSDKYTLFFRKRQEILQKKLYFFRTNVCNFGALML